MIKKRAVKIAAAAVGMTLILGVAGCSAGTAQETAAETAGETQTAGGETEEPISGAENQTPEAAENGDVVRVGAMKGPTSMGLVYMMHQANKGETQTDYQFTMETAADTLMPRLMKGELDIALLPTNVASILYHKSEGAVSVIDINTLGVLYVVSSDTSVTSVQQLTGKTLYLTGKGTTPDFVIQYLLKQNGLSATDVKLEYKSEPTEVAALLAQNPDSFGMLPQPFATAACAQNESLQSVIDITAEWDAVSGSGGSQLVTGVTVVRKAFLEACPEAVAAFLADHEESAEYVNENVADASEMVADLGIIEKAPIAAKAIPQCHITCIKGEEMKKALSGYLGVLYEMDAQSVGGSLPQDDFYAVDAAAK